VGACSSRNLRLSPVYGMLAVIFASLIHEDKR
jgi:hypothetical protein